MKNCPYCDELIKKKAKKCRYCHEFLDREDESIDIDLDEQNKDDFDDYDDLNNDDEEKELDHCEFVCDKLINTHIDFIKMGSFGFFKKTYFINIGYKYGIFNQLVVIQCKKPITMFAKNNEKSSNDDYLTNDSLIRKIEGGLIKKCWHVKMNLDTYEFSDNDSRTCGSFHLTVEGFDIMIKHDTFTDILNQPIQTKPIFHPLELELKIIKNSNNFNWNDII